MFQISTPQYLIKNVRASILQQKLLAWVVGGMSMEAAGPKFKSLLVIFSLGYF